MITPFKQKVNAQYQGDPKGTYVLAEDINLIQDAVNNLERGIGMEPGGDTIVERIEAIEKSGLLRTDEFLLYKGNPLLAYNSQEEAVHAFSYRGHVVLSKLEDSSFYSFIDSISSRGTSVYGYVDCSSTYSIAVIQMEIEWWKSKGAVGIFLDKFDYDFGNTRSRQNTILLSVQERKLTPIVTGSLEYIIQNQEHANNPEWMPLAFQPGNIYYLPRLFIDNAQKNPYDNVLGVIKPVLQKKAELKIQIMIEDTANGSQSAVQDLYEHGESLAILFGAKAYGLSRTDNYALNDPVRLMDWAPFIGGWREDAPYLVESMADIRRKTSFGEVIYVKSSNTVVYTGLTIPSYLLTFKANSINGSAIQDGSIEDKKIKEYDGNRLIKGINKEGVTEKINIKRIQSIGFDDLTGSISVEALQANVINAINANIGNAKIDNAVIGNLTAGHISADVIEAINIASGHAEFGTVQIHGAVIDQLKAESITSGSIHTDRLEANVLNALNLKAGHAEIDSALIGELRAESITAEVVKAINMYAESAIIDKAKINNAVIGSLKAEHIQAEIIKAVNASIENAQIDKAKIGHLDAEHIEAAVIEAVNANIGNAFIQGGIIQDGTIMDAKIFSLSASKLTAGQIDTGLIRISGTDGHMVIDDNSIEIYDGTDKDGNRRKRVIVGHSDMLGSDTYGLIVMGADGSTRLFDHTGVYNEGIHENAVSNDKLQGESVDSRVLSVGAVYAKHVQADAITAEKIISNAIVSRHIQAGTVTTDKLFSGGKLRSVSDNRAVTVSGGTLVSGGPCARGLETGHWKTVIGTNLVVDLGQEVNQIREISFATTPVTDVTRTPLGFTLEASRDNKTWGQIAKRTDNIYTVVAEIVDFPTPIRYVRLTIDKAQAGKTDVYIANLEVKSMEGGTVINGDTIRTGTIDANLVNVKNVKADAISVGANTSFENGYNPFEAWTAAQNLSTKGLSIKPDYSAFNTAATNKFYFHGFDNKGLPADVDGYLMVTGQKVTVKKGVLSPVGATKGYMFYDKTATEWYLAALVNNQWRKYNEGKTGHNTVFTPNENCYFVGYLEV